MIKETTRLFPAASGVRWGCAGEDLVGAEGARYWPEPDAFLPKHWLVEPGHALHPPQGAWQPFEHGLRGCIGQDLVTGEMAVPLVVLMREWDFRPAYDEWDETHTKKGPRTYRGDRA